MTKKLCKLKEIQLEILHGDLLLFRKRGLISTAGRGEYSHAAKVFWWDNILLCAEVREFYGGRIVTLESQVNRFPGVIDVFRANAQNRWPLFNRHNSVKYILNFAGQKYGYKSVFLTALTHIPFLRFLRKPNVSDCFTDNNPPFCSQACSMADRIGGGVDPVPHLADSFCEPSDLARSPFYDYQFTLE